MAELLTRIFASYDGVLAEMTEAYLVFRGEFLNPPVPPPLTIATRNPNDLYRAQGTFIMLRRGPRL